MRLSPSRRSFGRPGETGPVIYLLDTTVLVDVANGVGTAPQLFAQLFAGGNTLLTCDVIVAEALSRGSPEELADIERLLGVLEYVSTHPDAARRAGGYRRLAGKTSRRTLGDALIAGVASFNGATVVTRNPDDFVAQGIPVLTYG
jgi:predicted nucleic acid-binding protein